MGKGSNRRPENSAALERNWPFPPRKREEPSKEAPPCDEGGGPCEKPAWCSQHGCFWSRENTKRWADGTLPKE